jgi:predicted Fe-Mo cluster-binding NifX family protein
MTGVIQGAEDADGDDAEEDLVNLNPKKGFNMRICIPTEGDEGKKADVCQHFGSAPYFTICDTDKGTFEVVPNNNEHHAHGACNPLGVLSGKNIEAIVCIGMGPRAIQKLKESGTRTFITNSATVKEVLEECQKGILKEIDINEGCRNHSCHD